ncbi:MAG: hypothetical protein ACO29V_09285 [Limnohabitans sp.]
MNTANAFAEEQLRRAVLSCKDIYEIRQLALRSLDMLKTQRQVFDSLIHWPNPYIPPADDR